jgi:DNA-binding transcriptional MerR regulator
MSVESPLWTIEELSNRVAEALALDYGGIEDNRVRDVPDQRTIRYYTTLGLLGRPTMRGRTALYGVRHVLQLAAIKRLQAARWPLAKIQQTLLGLPDQQLAKIARIGVEAVPQPAPANASPGAFWKEAPAAPVHETSSSAEPEPETDDVRAQAARLLQGIELAEAVTLLVKTTRPLADDDLQAIRAVAVPLIQILHQRRLLARAEKGTSHEPAAADPV